MQIRTEANEELLFAKLKGQGKIKLDEVYSEIPGATKLINQQWLAGKFHFNFKKADIPIELLPNGQIVPDSVFTAFAIIGYDGRDFLHIQKKGGDWIAFMIEHFSASDIRLAELQSRDEEGAPIIKTGKKAVLIRQPRR